MSMFLFFLIMVSVVLSVAGQILFKHGMSSQVVQTGLETSFASGILSVITNMSVMIGLSAYVASTAFWLVVLSKLDVSKAYPFLGLGFVLTMLFAYFFLHEPLSNIKVIGTLLVIVGVLLISTS